MKIYLTKPKFDDEEIELLKKCLSSGWVTQGPFTMEFERLFRERHKVKYALAVSSCTAALHLAVIAMGLKKGEEVVVPAFTWVTSASCVEYVGGKVVFADVELDTFNLDPQALEYAITENTKGIIVVHLFGQSAKMDEIKSIANKYGLFIIEDAACAVGTTYKGKPVGSLGNIGCFSFHPRKIITTGEGGMLTTDSTDIMNKLKSLRNHGATGHLLPAEESSKPYWMSPFDMLGYNYRMSDIQACVGVAQMKKLDFLLQERKKLAERYTELLSEMEEIALPIPNDKRCGHTYQSYVIRIKKGGLCERNKIMEYLNSLGIQTRPGTHAVHRLGYYKRKYNLKPEDFPNASKCEDTTITLPLFPDMSEKEQNFVVSSLKQAVAYVYKK